MISIQGMQNDYFDFGQISNSITPIQWASLSDLVLLPYMAWGIVLAYHMPELLNKPSTF